MNSKICGGFFPQLLFFFLACNSVRIGQNLLKEVPGERSILDDFANYLLNVGLNGKLNGPGRMICVGPYGPKTTKADVKELTKPLP